jgi:hypothetical protein
MTVSLIYHGASRTLAAEAGGVTLQVVRDWVPLFNAYVRKALIDRKRPGHPFRLNDEHRGAQRRRFPGRHFSFVNSWNRIRTPD